MLTFLPCENGVDHRERNNGEGSSLGIQGGESKLRLTKLVKFSGD